ncbi:hypothetical protein [Burkholderia ubonensis]|uniref:hypothetical protein n=1 Tax=Burkholderia ubonensis TaxID=101571 RepID=UPI00162682A2|nr:hypothetical protein [Burkholderia ubonensis]
MHTLHFHYEKPLIVINGVVDDFGDVLTLTEDFGSTDAWYAAWEFARDGGAIPQSARGTLY